MAKFWKVSEFKKVNKPWGHFRKVIGEIPVLDTSGIIYLMRENDDGRETIAVHDKRNGHQIVKLGLYFVDSDESKQKALDAIYDTLMGF